MIIIFKKTKDKKIEKGKADVVTVAVSFQSQDIVLFSSSELEIIKKM